MRTCIIVVGLGLAIAWAAVVSLAGPITPPVGPIASTAKPLAEIEPRIAINAANTPGDSNSRFKIAQPGSYYLTDNITGVSGKLGIEIAASGVTLDLNGFDLVGVAGSLDGVTATVSGLSSITVRNGSVRGWGGDGVDLGSLVANNSAVIDLRAGGNGGVGILIGSGSTITGCSVYQNTGNGISTGIGCTIARCTASGNVVSGVSAGLGSTITGCSAYNNTASGIAAANGCTITGCTAYTNSSSGIAAGTACTISNCTARQNAVDGIVVSAGCLILANTCSNFNPTGSAGIHATGADNRIEGNNCTNYTHGMDVDIAGNIIIRNTCSGNTVDWVFAANNVFGPIIDRRAPSNAAVSGFSAASTFGSTDPNANISY